MKYLLLIITLFFSGCTTIHFDNGKDIGQLETEKWHHNFFLALYEGSNTVDLERACGEKEWSSVKTEESFINGLASAVVAAIVPLIWYPKTVEISCK